MLPIKVIIALRPAHVLSTSHLSRLNMVQQRQ